ncbi:unnamed protein product, partial [Brassica rapa]
MDAFVEENKIVFVKWCRICGCVCLHCRLRLPAEFRPCVCSSTKVHQNWIVLGLDRHDFNNCKVLGRVRGELLFMSFEVAMAFEIIMCKLISNAGLCCFGIESTTADLFSSSTQACDTRVASKQVVGTVTGSNITHLFLGLGESAT